MSCVLRCRVSPLGRGEFPFSAITLASISATSKRIPGSGQNRTVGHGRDRFGKEGGRRKAKLTLTIYSSVHNYIGSVIDLPLVQLQA